MSNLTPGVQDIDQSLIRASINFLAQVNNLLSLLQAKPFLQADITYELKAKSSLVAHHVDNPIREGPSIYNSTIPGTATQTTVRSTSCSLGKEIRRVHGRCLQAYSLLITPAPVQHGLFASGFPLGLFSNSGACSWTAPRLPGVVGTATRALVRQNVELHVRCHSTIVAEDPYHLLLTNCRHRGGCNLLIKLSPYVRHVASRPQANRARELLMGSHLVQALQMNRVSTMEHADSFRRVE